VGKRTASSGLGSLGSGAVTAVALAVQTGLAAIVGVVLARNFGRGAQTDGFFSSYGVFVVVVLAANAIRVAVLPPLARARGDRRLGAEVAAYGMTLALIAVPLLVLGLVAASPVSWLLTGNGPAAARHSSADALPWMLAAAVLQLYAGLAASALAALDNYVVAAAGYSVGSIVGLGYILWRVHPDGIGALSRGMVVNGAIALLVPAAALALRARSARMPPSAIQPTGLSFKERMAELGTGVALPLAMQAIYVVCLPLAAREGVGSQTSFGYAYLIASAIVAVTASSLSFVTSVPLTRVGLDPERTARHVVSSSWIAVVVIGASAGVFGLVGGRIAHVLLGSGYGAHVGSQLGRVVVVLSLWAVTSVGASVTFPLVFVAGRGRWLPALAVGALVVHVPLAFAGQVLFGLDGLALALAASTAIMLVGMLVGLHAVRPTARGLGVAALTVAVLAAAAFVPPRLLLGSVAAAALGLALYAALLGLVRPRGLLAAWRYLHNLG
jgi:hypothetical protein